MLKSEFEKLKVKEIKELLTGDVEFENLMWAQEDARTSVQKLATAYVMQQKRKLQEQQRLEKLYMYEESFYAKDLYHVVGIDEVGRGPIAGPVTVAAVILPPKTFLPGINDSKKLSPKKREELYEQIIECAVSWACISYDREIIDELNIYNATRHAMYEVIKKLEVPAEAVLVDAMPLNDLEIPHLSLIKGDSKSISIAAASIIAKVTRDRYMDEMDKKYPGFGFADHKGYYTATHKEAIEKLGITPIHRHSFEPIKSMVADKK